MTAKEKQGFGLYFLLLQRRFIEGVERSGIVG